MDGVVEATYLLGNAENDLALPMAVDLRSGFSSHIASQDREFCERAEVARGGR